MAKEEKKCELTPGLKAEIVELVIKTYREEIERQRKTAFDRRLRNTKLLLVNYRGLLAYSAVSYTHLHEDGNQPEMM